MQSYRTKPSAWARFRALPGIVQFGAWLAVVILLLIASPAAAGDLVMRSSDGAQELRLYESACSHGGTLGHIRARFQTATPEQLAKFRNVRILDRRGTIESYGCWLESDDGRAFIMFEDGSNTEFTLSKFKDPMV